MLSFLYVKDLFAPKYEHLIKQQENVGQKHFKEPKVFTEYSHDTRNVFKRIEEKNPGKERC